MCVRTVFWEIFEFVNFHTKIFMLNNFCSRGLAMKILHAEIFTSMLFKLKCVLSLILSLSHGFQERVWQASLLSTLGYAH